MKLYNYHIQKIKKTVKDDKQLKTKIEKIHKKMKKKAKKKNNNYKKSRKK